MHNRGNIIKKINIFKLFIHGNCSIKMADTKKCFDKEATPGKQAKGAGQGCAQQHRRDSDCERGRELFLRKEPTQRIPCKNQISWIFSIAEVDLDAG
jgi:hypothetical protein